MINSQKYTKLLITKNQKKISNLNSTISKKTTKTRKRYNSYFLDDTEIQENTQQTQSQRKISDPNSALFLISQENQNQKKVEKKKMSSHFRITNPQKETHTTNAITKKNIKI